MSFKDWGIRTKLLVLVAVMGLIIAAVGFVGYNGLQDSIAYSDRVEGNLREALTGSRINTNTAVLNRVEFRLAAEPSAEQVALAVKAIEAERKLFESRLVEIKRSANAAQERQIAVIEESYRGYLARLEDTLARARQYGGEAASNEANRKIIEAARAGEDQASKLRMAMREYLTYASERADALSVEAKQAASRATTTMIWVAALGVIGGIVFGYLLSTFAIGRPLAASVAGLNELARGKRQVEIYGLGRKDEVGDIAAALQVFKNNVERVDALQQEQAQAKSRAEADKRAAMMRLAGEFESAVGGIVKSVSTAASELQVSAESLTTTAELTSRQATAVAAASEQASTNVQTVASAGEELSSSISEIGRQVGQSTHIAGQAVVEAQSTDAKVQGLAEAAQRIGDVVRLINDIAGQTNLLALNATIEAARAGEAGKGFAVVASEVKSLANQTAKATDEIAAQISAIQAATRESVEAIQSIGRTIGEVNEIATTIAAAVEEQGAATAEIARNVQEAARGTHEVSSNIGGVTESANKTGSTASEVLGAAQSLATQSEALQGVVDGFVMEVRIAGMSALEVIEAAKKDHRAFTQKVLDAVDGKVKVMTEMLSDHRHCRLGRWYDKANELVRQQPAYAELAGPHARVHAAGKRVIEILHRDGPGAARGACQELEQASSEVLRLLDKLEEQLKAAEQQQTAIAA